MASGQDLRTTESMDANIIMRKCWHSQRQWHWWRELEVHSVKYPPPPPKKKKNYFLHCLYAATLTSSVDGRQAACPGEVVTYTCTVIQGIRLEWVAAPFIMEINVLQFTPSVPENTVLNCSDSSSAVQCSDLDYRAILTEVGTVQGGLADMTSTFRFTASARVNGTVVECRTTNASGIQRLIKAINVAGALHSYWNMLCVCDLVVIAVSITVTEVDQLRGESS